MKYNIWKDGSGYFRWQLKAANGEIIAHGEAYTSKQNCINAVNLVKGSSDAPTYDLT